MFKKDIEKVLNEALAVIRDGGVILYPTDTVWGLGCDATNPEAVARIYGINHLCCWPATWTRSPGMSRRYLRWPSTWLKSMTSR